jgi:drug/metabolite transporter (DMT)-like permease
VPVGAVVLTGFASQFCLAKAFRHGDAAVVVPLDFIRVPLITLVGWWLYRERLDAFVFLGAGGIVFSVLRAEAARKAGNAK